MVRKVEFPGVNMGIGHIRSLTWAKDNDQKKWIAYNRLRGQYMSALEHAVPERFFNDPAQCNLIGTEKPVPGLPNCPRGISAVKALGLAAAQGQRIYTITPEVYAANPNIVNTALSAHSVDTKGRVQRALDSGMEVTIHQAPIVESGWKGAGFTSNDPVTGSGAHTIEGGMSGGALFLAALGAILGIGAIVLAPAAGAAMLLATAIFYLLVFSIPAFVGAGVLLHGSDFLGLFASTRLYVAFLAFVALVNPVSFQVFVGSAFSAIFAMLIGYILG